MFYNIALIHAAYDLCKNCHLGTGTITWPSVKYMVSLSYKGAPLYPLCKIEL